jgi:hypothetical protein
LREEHRPRVFEKKVLRRIFGSKRDEITVAAGDCIMRSFIVRLNLVFSIPKCFDICRIYRGVSL